MKCRFVFSLLVVGIGWLSPAGAAESGPEVILLDVSKQHSLGVPLWFEMMPDIERMPVGENPPEGEGKFPVADEPAPFVPRPDTWVSFMSELGQLGGKQIICFRYIKSADRTNAEAGAEMLALFCNMDDRAIPEYAPFLLLVPRDWGTTGDFTVSGINQLDNLSFVWVRRHYSGTGNHLDRYTITWDETAQKFVNYELFAEEDQPLKSYYDLGWKPWHRGHWFDEDTLTVHAQLHHENPPAGQSHMRVKIPYRFQEGKLRPGMVEELRE